MSNVRGFKARQRGQGMTEYIIIVALIAIAAIGVVTFFGGALRNQVAGMASELAGQSATPSVNAAKSRAVQAQAEANKAKGLDTYNNK
ncbi:pilus assembly protein [Lysobacter sp. GCM10012299]|jgi:pilus assembly protein Flp/PilA|uniref:pilus assembly protein n=1 Tax=Lysobacter sp. GCM10012299 TaxID=3317333 RepID=UPI00361C450A